MQACAGAQAVPALLRPHLSPDKVGAYRVQGTWIGVTSQMRLLRTVRRYMRQGPVSINTSEMTSERPNDPSFGAVIVDYFLMVQPHGVHPPFT